jgi:signal recognition particle receptor subunit alpha
MIDFFSIFTTGGLILWCKTFLNMKIELLINSLIKNILLDEKRTQEFYVINGVVMRWRIINDSGLIFVLAYQEAYNVLYTDKLLEIVVQDFTANKKESLRKIGKVYFDNPDYNDTFFKLLTKWEKYCQEEIKNNRNSSNNYKKQKTSDVNGKTINGDTNNKEKKEDLEDNPFKTSDTTLNQGKSSFNPNIPKKNQMNRSSAPLSKKSEKNDNKTKKKEGRVWDSEYQAVNNENLKKYDHSIKNVNEVEVDNKKNIFLGEADPDNLDDRSIDENLSDKDDDIDITDMNTKKETKKSGGLFSKLTSSLKNYIGNKVLTEEDLEKTMKEFTNLLMEKNVAKEIAENLCDSVSKSLLNTKTQSFTTIATTVKNALKETITKILTPKQEFDVLKQALAARKRGEPYKIVFIGVNGVGKSTNLAKVGYLLMNNGMKILIAACDNFRSGAVEQLKVHTKALGVDLFEKGYKDDAAYIAKEAIDDAKKKGYDCVLIDTAGRMQDNEPLMKSLAKLIEINQPDAILFVGEALTGNDSVDQLQKFNQALIDNSKKEKPRTIDGIILTKFDTVDDKVGAALTMVYTTGKPIVYVGTGQKYTNLKKLNVNNVLNALFA